MKEINKIIPLKGEGKVSRIKFNDGESKIIKIQAIEGEEFEATNIERISNEIATAKFISELDSKISSNLDSFELEKGILVFEDLGSTVTVMKLIDTKGERGIEHLIGMYRVFAKLHGLSMNKTAEFRKIQTNLKSKSPLSDSTFDLRNRIKDFEKFFEFLDFSKQDINDLISEINLIENFLFDKEEYQSVIHGDSGPHNVVFTANGYRLVDLEFGSIGCFSQDIVGHRLGFPQTWLGKRMPKTKHKELERAYFEELSKYCDIAYEEYNKLLNYSSIHWVLVRTLSVWRMMQVVHLKKEELNFSDDVKKKIPLKLYTLLDGVLETEISDLLKTLFSQIKERSIETFKYVKEETLNSFD